MAVEVFLAKAAESLDSATADFSAGRFNSSARGGYYAAFQTAIAALTAEGITPEAHWGHGFVQAQFAGMLIHRRKRYGSDLRHVLADCLKLRQRADYEEAMVSERWCRHLLGESKRFLDAVRSRLNGDG